MRLLSPTPQRPSRFMTPTPQVYTLAQALPAPFPLKAVAIILVSLILATFVFLIPDRRAEAQTSSVVTATLPPLSTVTPSTYTAYTTTPPDITAHQWPELLTCTRDQSLLEALSVLAKSPSRSAIDVLLAHNGKVVFKDMALLGPQVATFDALSWISHSGQWVIFINERHKDAPPEALAALIAHEAVHDDIHNSLQEEVVGWTQEAKTWQYFTQQNPSLASNIDPVASLAPSPTTVAKAHWWQKSPPPPQPLSLVQRLQTLSHAYQHNTLTQLVHNNPGYAHLH